MSVSAEAPACASNARFRSTSTAAPKITASAIMTPIRTMIVEVDLDAARRRGTDTLQASACDRAESTHRTRHLLAHTMLTYPPEAMDSRMGPSSLLSTTVSSRSSAWVASSPTTFGKSFRLSNGPERRTMV